MHAGRLLPTVHCPLPTAARSRVSVPVPVPVPTAASHYCSRTGGCLGCLGKTRWGATKGIRVRHQARGSRTLRSSQWRTLPEARAGRGAERQRPGAGQVPSPQSQRPAASRARSGNQHVSLIASSLPQLTGFTGSTQRDLGHWHFGSVAHCFLSCSPPTSSLQHCVRHAAPPAAPSMPKQHPCYLLPPLRLALPHLIPNSAPAQPGLGSGDSGLWVLFPASATAETTDDVPASSPNQSAALTLPSLTALNAFPLVSSLSHLV